MGAGDLQNLLDALPLPALAIARSEHIVAANAGALALLGEQATGRNFVNHLRQPDLVEAIEACLADAQARRATWLAREGGQDTTWAVDLAVLPGEGPVVLCFQDMTHRAQSEQMRRDFVANVSHELRSPLTTLTGFIETLQGPARNDEAARLRFLKIMAAEADRMNRLVDDLLSLNRLEAQERVRPTERIDLRDVLNRARHNLANMIQEAGADIHADIPSEPLMMEADADQLLQVFTNLIENAVKYGGTENRITLDVSVSTRDPALRAPGVRVSVSDTGPGIDPLHLPRLTERFYRGDTHRSRTTGGTGLGLAIVKHILNRHRGRLKVSSTPGQGADFTVILPLRI